MSTISQYKKSLLALLAAVGVIVAFAADGEFSQNDIIGTLAAVAGVIAVYTVRNQPATVRPDDVGGDDGTMDIGEALVIAILVILIVFVLTRLF